MGKYVEKCTTVEWEECWETCKKDCIEMHFREPSQEVDHRRWCSPHEIVVHPDPHHDPHRDPHTPHPHPHAHPGVDHSPSGDQEFTDKQSINKLTDKQLTNKVTNSNIDSNQRLKKGNSFSDSKVVTTISNQRSKSQRTSNPDSPLVFSRPATESNRRSSVPQNFQGKRTIRQGQRTRG